MHVSEGALNSVAGVLLTAWFRVSAVLIMVPTRTLVFYVSCCLVSQALNDVHAKRRHEQQHH